MADAVLGLTSLAKEIQPYIGLKHKLWQDLPQGSGEQVWRRTATESWGCQARCRGLETINTVLEANSLDLCDAGHNARLVQRSRWQKIDTAKSPTTKPTKGISMTKWNTTNWYPIGGVLCVGQHAFLLTVKQDCRPIHILRRIQVTHPEPAKHVKDNEG